MFKSLVVAAFILRISLMPISVHSDLFFINSFPSLIYKENVYDIFSFMANNFSNRSYTYYPPLTYYTFGLFQGAYGVVSDTFGKWMYELYLLEKAGFVGQASDFIANAPNPNIYKDLFLAKVPYLLFDIAFLLVLYKLYRLKLIEKNISLLWLFNPVHLYGTYLMGQFDVIPTFFVLLAFLLLRKRILSSLLMLGIAMSYKSFPVIFALPIILIYGKSLFDFIKMFLLVFMPFSVFLAPALINNFGYATFAFAPKVYVGRNKDLNGWPLMSQTLKYTILSISYICSLAFSKFAKLKDKWRFSVGISLASILLVYALAPRISFQYLLWSTPLIFLWFKRFKVCSLIVLVQAFSLASYKLLANHLQVGLFAPINTNYSSLPTLNALVDQIFPYKLISNLGFFVFLVFNLILVFLILKKLLFESETSLVAR